MKVIHIADTHLGASPHQDNSWGINREKELWQAIERVVHIAQEKKADLLLIAGDMFHRQPLVRELKELNYVFAQLTHTKVVFIAGNHDYMKENSYYKTFVWAENVFCLKSQECESVYFPELNVEIYGLSYYHYEIRENLYAPIQIKNNNRINILLAHGGDEKHIPFSKTQLGSKGFDYIALGHIHIPAVLIPDRMAYAGALEPMDSNEEGPHGYIEVQLDEKKSNATFVPCAKREYITLEIQSDSSFTNTKLYQTIQETIKSRCSANSFIKIIIKGYKDEDIVYDLEDVYKMGLVVSVLDLSEPDYDFDKLATYYNRNIIGKFIQNLKSDTMSEVKKKALYYGVKAMLDEMR
ncbi:MAG: exonuclease SbcCD subunit D [Lachnotalea sp.]